jgi:hypothetical protein
MEYFSRHIKWVIVVVVLIGAIPAALSYQVTGSVNHYVPATKHLLWGWTDCEGNLMSWVRYSRNRLELAYYTIEKYKEPSSRKERLLILENNDTETTPELNDMLTYVKKIKLDYEQDNPPFFCHPMVFQVWQNILRLNENHLEFYLVLYGENYEDSTAQFDNLVAQLNTTLVLIAKSDLKERFLQAADMQ